MTSKIHCPVCFEKFNKTCHKPITINCGHTCCTYCLHQTEVNNVEFECVLCRKSIRLEADQFDKNILLLDLLEQTGQLGKDDPCLAVDCALCNPPSHRCTNSTGSSVSQGDMAEILDQLTGYFEALLQANPETVRFMQQGVQRAAERRLLDAFFELLGECSSERETILSAATNLPTQDPDGEIRQVRLYARQFEALCTYMLTAILRLRTLNSFPLYSIQRIRSYFPLRFKVEFVELTHDDRLPLSTRERLNLSRLEERLARISLSTNVYRIFASEYIHNEECDFIEIIPDLQLVHCLICNSMINGTDNDSIDSHVQEITHQRLLQEVESIPFEILLTRARSFRIRSNNEDQVIEEQSSRPNTSQQTSRSNAENRHPTFFG